MTEEICHYKLTVNLSMDIIATNKQDARGKARRLVNGKFNRNAGMKIFELEGFNVEEKE